jgi:membrane-bound lytic murein transglycosylase B
MGTRGSAAACLTALTLAATACAGPATEQQATPVSPAPAPRAEPPSTAPADLLSRATRDGVRRPRTAAQAARQVLAAENAIRRPGTSPERLATAGELAQVAYRVIGNRTTWDERVLAALPRRLHRVVERNVASRREFRSMHYTLSDTLPAWRIMEPEPAEELLAHYREAEQRFGVDWEYLAAINLVETGMGRIRGLSVAGAQGPMQFIPATWAQYGAGDINDPRDAIMAAGRYLADRGFTERDGIAGALYSYNNHPAYVRGVTKLARVMQADSRAFLGYYHWQVYYLSSAGDVVLRPGYESRTEIPVARFLRSNPSALSS